VAAPSDSPALLGFSLVDTCPLCHIAPGYTNVYAACSRCDSAKEDADTLLNIVLAEIDYCNEKLQVGRIGWCSDVGGDSKGMWVKLHNQREWLITVDCWTHQVSCVTKKKYLTYTEALAEQPRRRRLFQAQACLP